MLLLILQTVGSWRWPALWLTLLMLLFTGTACVPWLEHQLLYAPVAHPDGFWDARAMGVPVEECFFTAADGERLHGWYAPPGPGAPVLLICHGNRSNLTYRAMWVKRLAEQGLGVLIFDYRGFGKSSGTPSEAGLYRDGEAALSWLAQQGIRPEGVVLFGRSLGGGVASELAVRHPEVAGLILESTFTSVPGLADQLIPLLPAGWLIRSRFDNLARMPHLRVPILIVHGTEDELIPFTEAEALHRAAPEGLKAPLFAIPNGRHGAWLEGGEAHLERVIGFCWQVTLWKAACRLDQGAPHSTTVSPATRAK